MASQHNIYAQLTKSILEQLEQGVLPWRKTWEEGQDISRPLRHTGERYRGINVIILWLTATRKNYTSSMWMTFRQAQLLGGHVRSKEKGTRVLFASNFVPKDQLQLDEAERKKIIMVKHYSVFNINQIESLPNEYYQPQSDHQHVTITDIEEFCSNLGVELTPGPYPAYNPSLDSITLPPLQQFESAEAYYATLAHELIHWTGKGTRLNRHVKSKFGDEQYAMEELIAELGACFLCADWNIDSQTLPEQVSYIQGWRDLLSQKERAIFHAAAQAEKAVSYIHQLTKQTQLA